MGFAWLSGDVSNVCTLVPLVLWNDDFGMSPYANLYSCNLEYVTAR